MIYYAIVEFHNGQFNCVYAPYTSFTDACDHRDRLAKRWTGLPVTITFQITKTYHPDHIG